WRGRFFGVWQGVPFDHTVTFSGPPDNLRGTATIDNAHYDWTGQIDVFQKPARFSGAFGGTRYAGQFDLQSKPGRASASLR
ncbi:MAG TPA: hypothetical protein VFV87_05330, partial [Pirellulaceae bacterium]|nr:hypothetical protein [Pirellulaceae bacterium]